MSTNKVVVVVIDVIVVVVVEKKKHDVNTAKSHSNKARHKERTKGK